MKRVLESPSSVSRARRLGLGALLLAAAAANARAQAPIVRVNVTPQGTQSNGQGSLGRNSAISDDGRYVVFQSDATDLVAGDHNGRADVFVSDLVTGGVVRVSVSSAGVEGNQLSGQYGAVISADGRFVAFTSSATNLVAGDGNNADDVFVHDRDPDGNGIFDEGNGTTERVSVSSSGVEGNSASDSPSISSDGDVVAFRSYASNLISVDKNGKWDVFVRTRSSSSTIRASRNNSNQGADDDSTEPQISADGSMVVFMSRATNLVSSGGGYWQVFVRDLVNNATELASSDASGNRLAYESQSPGISGDGRYVVFKTSTPGLVPENDPSGLSQDAFVKDRSDGSLRCATVGPDGYAGHGVVYCSISADGAKVAFTCGYDGFVAADTNGSVDVFVRDLASNAIVCASVNAAGVPAARGTGTAYTCPLSADGRFVVFGSDSTELVPDDTNVFYDAFRNDLSNPGFQAYWTNYGAGWPGTHGVPGFTCDVDPEFGATVTVTAENSVRFWTVGFFFLGAGEAALPTNRGGTLWVDVLDWTTVVIPPAGWSTSDTIPYDPALAGSELDLQMIEVDAGASRQFSFTPGLKLVLGR